VNHKWSFLFILILLALAGCSASTKEPTEISQNIDSCDVCKMGISEIDSAAQMILKNGKPVLFDDVGCMVVYIQDEKPEYEAAFVHDYHSKEWISFDQSTFVHNHSIDSPMSYHIAAFEREDDAVSFHKEHGGKVYTSSDLIKADTKILKTSEMEHGH